MDQKLIIPPKTKAINLYFVRLSVKCSTKIVKKANGDCACGFILWEVLTWTQAIQACKARGARLAEIYSIEENNDIKSFLFQLVSIWQEAICIPIFLWGLLKCLSLVSPIIPWSMQ